MLPFEAASRKKSCVCLQKKHLPTCLFQEKISFHKTVSRKTSHDTTESQKKKKKRRRRKEKKRKEKKRKEEKRKLFFFFSGLLQGGGIEGREQRGP